MRLAIQAQITLGRLDLILGMGEVKRWQRTVTKSWKWHGGPKGLREFLGTSRGSFTGRNLADVYSPVEA